MTEKQGQLQTKTLVNALQHGITVGPGGIGTVIRIYITPLIGQCRPRLLVKKTLPGQRSDTAVRLS